MSLIREHDAVDMRQRGFGLIEVMVALALGLILVLGVVQIFLSSKQGFVLQQSAALLQENARFILSRMSRELRMVNMYGCLDLHRLPQSVRNEFPAAFEAVFDQPISYNGNTLTIISAVPNSERFTGDQSRQAGDYGARWLIASDCRDTGDLRISESESLTVRAGDILIPLRQVEYRVAGTAIQTRINGNGNFETLIDGVAALNVDFGLAASATDLPVAGDYLSAATVSESDFARIRSVRLALQLSDNPTSPADGQVRAQDYRVVVALRNRMN